MERKQARRTLIDDAKRAIRERVIGQTEALLLVKRLKREQLFDFACRVLALVRNRPTPDDTLRLKLAQEFALCTYKDQDTPSPERLDAALVILKQSANLDTTDDQETLGLAGSIYKQKWLADGQKQHLELSFRFYYRGHLKGITSPDAGYTGINAAFVLDLLAEIETQTDPEHARLATERRKLSARIRRETIDGLLALTGAGTEAPSYWYAVTIAEAYFGVRDYINAAEWLKRAKALPVEGWQQEATARQLAQLASIQAGASHTGETEADARHGENGPAFGPYDVLRDFLDLPEDVIRGAFLGKVGLALSGGGFRASLFHIGVLARLAEQDILSRVETLSCVSGGSIIGTHYYLELRALLQSKPDSEITRQDYVALVQRVAANFLAGVQSNVRMRSIASMAVNLRIAFSRGYSRTHRLGELYESIFFNQVRDGNDGRPRFLDGIHIQPKGSPEDFHPRWDNWHRRAKVPTLILNATSINTGHLWQFTASYMGEPASCINTAVDGNYRLRRMYFEEAPEGFRKVRLGHAVAASACVPGLFEPLQLRGLYPGIAVALVDGGVHDNQGLVGVTEQGCDNIIVSDASGQMGQIDSPSVGYLPSILRSNSILQARLRDTQLRALDTRSRSSALRTTVVHLKQELTVEPRDWAGCDDPKQRESDDGSRTTFTTYGIRRDLQRLLAEVRTDLDSFCDAEAHALMISGYHMMDRQLSLSPQWKSLERLPVEWPFQRLERAMREATEGDRLTTILRTASVLPFKAWRLVPALKYLSVALAVAIVGLMVYIHLRWGPRTLVQVANFLAGVIPEPLRVPVGDVIFIIVGVTAASLVSSIVARTMHTRNIASRFLLSMGVAAIGWLVARVHLSVFDRLYLGYGRSSNFKP